MASDATIVVDGSKMTVTMGLPPGAGPHPGLVVGFQRDGIDRFTRSVGERLAANGFVAAIPDTYHRRPPGEHPHISQELNADRDLRADIDASIAYLQSLPSVRADAIGVIGHCAGGRTAFLAAGTNRHVKAAVVLYGGGIFRARGEDTPAPIDHAETIRCPILGLFGRNDRNPPPEDVARIDETLTRLGVRHEFRFYEDAGHAFQNQFGAARYREQSSEDAWTRLLAFLHAELK